MREKRSARRLVMMAAGLALLTAGIHEDTSAQTGLSRRPTARTSRDVSLLKSSKALCPGFGNIDPARELFITHVSVVDDCLRTTWGPCPPFPPPVPSATQGAWTFGGLMPGIFGTNNPAILHNEVMTWLNEWAVFHNINGDPVLPRPSIQGLVINPWLAASGTGQLDMKLAPFRLLAIVARLDLRQPGTAPGGRTAGEGRFVFNLLDPAGNPTEYLLIFEYELVAPLCGDVQNWARRWHALGTIPFGPNYNGALQAITDSFTKINAAPAKPNGSALNQARTNEIFLGAPWELREFTLQGGPVASLLMNTVAETPANSHQHSALFANFVNGSVPPFSVPLIFMGTPFRGGASLHSLDFNWDGPPPPCTSIFNNNDRHEVSLNTCNGCHGGETATIFKHVEPRFPGVPSVLSAFLTGGPPVVDMCGIPHNFNDIRRREADLCNLLNSPCSVLAEEPVINFVH